ncbi:MAG: exo-alpha-sialidase [Acidobacteria bacterium]|nr:exo-alpha-sialidase [Acidobacteriota bacterium]
MISVRITSLFLLLLFCSQLARAQEVPIFQAQLIFENDPAHPSSHAPTLVELKNGDLLAAWYAGTAEGAKDVVIKSARLPKGKTQWTKPVIAEATPSYNPILWVDKKGLVWMFYVTMSGSDWATCRVKYKTSKNDGKSWGKEAILQNEPGWMTGNKPTVLSNGEILLPLYDKRLGATVVMISSNQGKTWQQTASIKSHPGNIQASVVELTTGKLMMLMRSVGNMGALTIWQSFSQDKGRTWSPPQSSSLRHPNARIDQVRLQNGHLALAFNDTYQGRQQLNVALSVNEGNSWAFNRYLENQPGEYSDAAIIQTRDGRIHCVYTYRHTNIKHVTFNEAWLTQK